MPMNKLLPIAELIQELLEMKFREEAKYTFECKREWLVNTPDKELYRDFWDEITCVYSGLVDNKWSLDSILLKNYNDSKYDNARMDIWFHEPYNFMCEFDEKQHFNQFRLSTLRAGFYNDIVSFDYNHYLDLSESKIHNPGKSGFEKLKGKDSLFPEMLNGENQDNRIRQRAFRDFLKDIVPVRLGYNPTVRISYKVTNNKTKDFNQTDLDSIVKYFNDIDILSKIKLD